MGLLGVGRFVDVEVGGEAVHVDAAKADALNERLRRADAVAVEVLDRRRVLLGIDPALLMGFGANL